MLCYVIKNYLNYVLKIICIIFAYFRLLFFFALRTHYKYSLHLRENTPGSNFNIRIHWHQNNN